MMRREGEIFCKSKDGGGGFVEVGKVQILCRLWDGECRGGRNFRGLGVDRGQEHRDQGQSSFVPRYSANRR